LVVAGEAEPVVAGLGGGARRAFEGDIVWMFGEPEEAAAALFGDRAEEGVGGALVLHFGCIGIADDDHLFFILVFDGIGSDLGEAQGGAGGIAVRGERGLLLLAIGGGEGDAVGGVVWCGARDAELVGFVKRCDFETQLAFFQIRFLHQPVSEAAQEFGCRATACMVMRPEPHAIAMELRDTAFADSVEDEEGEIVAACHQDLAALGGGFGLVIPRPPLGGIAEFLGDWVFRAALGDLWDETLGAEIGERFGG